MKGVARPKFWRSAEQGRIGSPHPGPTDKSQQQCVRLWMGNFDQYLQWNYCDCRSDPCLDRVEIRKAIAGAGRYCWRRYNEPHYGLTS